MTLSKKKQLIDLVFKPDEHGCSGWVTREELDDAGLDLTTNGCGRYGTFWGDHRYVWEKKTKNPDAKTSKTLALRLAGFTETAHAMDRPISKAVREHFAGQCCVVCGRSSIVIDHKNDLYNDSRVLSTVTQTIEDFQPLCQPCNLQKRQINRTTRETGKRYGATNLRFLAPFGVDFTVGDESYDPEDPNAMVGTFWYDPVAFIECVHQGSLTKALAGLKI